MKTSRGWFVEWRVMVVSVISEKQFRNYLKHNTAENGRGLMTVKAGWRGQESLLRESTSESKNIAPIMKMEAEAWSGVATIDAFIGVQNESMVMDET